MTAAPAPGQPTPLPRQSFPARILAFLRYLLGKRSELSRLGKSDALMAKVVLDIHRKRTGSGFVFAPLHAILPIHPIDRGEAQGTRDRRMLAIGAAALPVSGRIGRDWLEAHLPSVSTIKVVRLPDGRYVSYEGNGRIGALQQVYPGRQDLEVEVEEYRFRTQDAPIILRRINRVRRWNGLGAIRP